jgi:hypothetical protein
MITLVSLERLELIYTGHSANFEKNKTSRLENQYFNEILEKLRKMF